MNANTIPSPAPGTAKDYGCQECVELILRIWYAPPNPPPSPTHFLKLLSTSCLCCCTNFYSFSTFYFYARIQLPPMTFFPLNCSMASAQFFQFPIHLCKPPFLSSFCLSLTACYFSPCLLTYYLLPLSVSPCGDISVCSTCPSLFSFSCFSLLCFHRHSHTGRVLKFICTSAADSTEPFRGSWL